MKLQDQEAQIVTGFTISVPKILKAINDFWGEQDFHFTQ